MSRLSKCDVSVIETWTGEPGARCFECGDPVIRGGIWVEGDTVVCVCPTCAKAGAPKLMGVLADAAREFARTDDQTNRTLAAMKREYRRALECPKPIRKLRSAAEVPR